MKITGERDGFLTRDISYFENIYDALHEDGDAERFLVKLDPKENIAKVNQELNELHAEIAKWQQKMEQHPNKLKKRKI